MRLYGINAKDLQRQVGFKKETINDFLKLRKTHPKRMSLMDELNKV
jgi:hypothetical protein